MTFTSDFLNETVLILAEIDHEKIEQVAQIVHDVRETNGRLFILGVGGSAGHAGHAVNDFRKICGVECYAPTDNVSELTARANDEGWDTIFSEWLKVSRFDKKDALLIFSVGGGDAEAWFGINRLKTLSKSRKRGER
jgi:D-sedoheptulose 7-phosphate isomerase